MRKPASVPRSVDDYIRRFPPAVQRQLQEVRQAARSAAPAAEEKISYGIPTLRQGRNLFHFAAAASHIGLYPGPEAVTAFGSELRDFRTSKGTVQVPLGRPLPLDLIVRMIRFNLARLPVRPGH